MLEGTPGRATEKQPSLSTVVSSRPRWIGPCRAVALLVLVSWAAGGAVVGANGPAEPRRVIDLNGLWQVEQGDLENVPVAFAHEVAVPGLLDMARPPFRNVGKVSPECQAFWYRRTFKVEGHAPEVALLKFHKARYGLRAILNGHDLGTHLPCFTPAYFDVKPFVKDQGQENVLIVRVGANPECLPPDMPRGWDFEKYLYIPGLYDTVELILTGAPFIKNVQIVPDLEKGTARAVVEVEAGQRRGEGHGEGDGPRGSLGAFRRRLRSVVTRALPGRPPVRDRRGRVQAERCEAVVAGRPVPVRDDDHDRGRRDQGPVRHAVLPF